MLTINSLKKVILTSFLFASSQLFATGVCVTTVEVNIPNNNIEVCVGNSIVLTSTVTHGGTKPKYQWYINDQKVGKDSTNFTFRPNKQGFNYVKLVVTSSESCKAEDSTTSQTKLIVVNSSQITFVDLQPSYFCNPKSNFLYLNNNFEPNISYKWFVNNQEIVGHDGTSMNITSEQFTDGFNVYVEATNLGACGNNITTKSNNSEYNLSKCKANLGDDVQNPKTLPLNFIIKDTVSNYSSGRSYNTCITLAKYYNVIDAFYEFVSTSDEVTISLNLDDETWHSSIALIDAENPQYPQFCNNEILTTNLREYTFNNLTPNKKYIVKIEIGSNTVIGHARLNQLGNTYTLKVTDKVNGIEDELTKLNKTVLRIINLQGQPVDNEFKGMVIYQFTDGTSMKIIQ